MWESPLPLVEGPSHVPPGFAEGDHRQQSDEQESWSPPAPALAELSAELRGRVEAELDLLWVLRQEFGYALEAEPTLEQPCWIVGRVAAATDPGVPTGGVRLMLWRREAAPTSAVTGAAATGWNWAWEANPGEWQPGGDAVELLAGEWTAAGERAGSPGSLAAWLERLLVTYRQGTGRGHRAG